jgi:hypothetical protein
MVRRPIAISRTPTIHSTSPGDRRYGRFSFSESPPTTRGAISATTLGSGRSPSDMSAIPQLRRYEQTKANQAPKQTDCATAFPCVRYDYDAGEHGEEHPRPTSSQQQGDKQDREHCCSDGLPVVSMFPKACVCSGKYEWRTCYGYICGKDKSRSAVLFSRAHPVTSTQCGRTRHSVILSHNLARMGA